MFTIRVAIKSDQAVIKSLIRQARLNPFRLDWHRFLVAEAKDGEVIGCGQIKGHRDGSRELSSLVVDIKWRGQGVAGAIIESLKTDAGSPLWLMCRSNLVPFYAGFGFLEGKDPTTMPPYFRAVRFLAMTHRTLTQREDYLAFMRWEIHEKKSKREFENQP